MKPFVGRCQNLTCPRESLRTVFFLLLFFVKRQRPIMHYCSLALYLLWLGNDSNILELKIILMGFVFVVYVAYFKIAARKDVRVCETTGNQCQFTVVRRNDQHNNMCFFLCTAEFRHFDVPRSITKFGDHNFCVCGPKLWNAVPVRIRNSPSISLFRKSLPKRFCSKRFWTFYGTQCYISEYYYYYYYYYYYSSW